MGGGAGPRDRHRGEKERTREGKALRKGRKREKWGGGAKEGIKEQESGRKWGKRKGLKQGQNGTRPERSK